MIRPPGVPGVVFGERADGDGRASVSARRDISSHLGIPDSWAYVDQVHGDAVVDVSIPGNHGEADGLVTATHELPLAIGTADCVPVVLIGPTRRGIAHAGWRGVANGVVPSAVDCLGETPSTVVIGPHIRSCCYEVGDEVIDACGGFGAATTAGTVSIDLSSAIRSQLPEDVSVVDLGLCTMCDDRFASFRRDRTAERQVSLVWI